ncbi:hypothetical protein LZ32DRAFT_322664 [Colletotrichum eremochloae]|nr:hypothetical protein LZ32DRAFT_322664 [Colletotrichum eremochloae]
MCARKPDTQRTPENESDDLIHKSIADNRLIITNMLRTVKDIALAFIRPTLDALYYGRHPPWSLRWRLLALQPVVFLTNSLVFAPNLFLPMLSSTYPLALTAPSARSWSVCDPRRRDLLRAR